MTVAQKSFIKNNIPSWINVTTLMVVVSFVVYQSRWQEKVDTHIFNESIHIPFEKKIQIFVPRIELDSRLSNIEASQKRQDAKQDQILEILMFGTK
jgi:hypothetical protein